MAANRLFLMVYYLLEKGSVTAPELAEHFEVSVRTIYRDVDILSAAGIPIYTTQGRGGGISIQENFVLNKSLISEQEQSQILMALQGMGLVDQENTDSILTKLSNIFQRKDIDWIEIDYSDWNRDSNFQTLKQAIFKAKKVFFIYNGTDGKAAGRTVEPLKLVFKNRDWYLYAYCCLRGDYRFFKLTRIKELDISAESFQRTAPSQVTGQIETHREQSITITMLFDKEMGYRVYDHFDKVTKREDGRFTVETSLPDNEWLYSFLLSFGGTVEVLSPQEVREELMSKINLMRSKYKT